MTVIAGVEANGEVWLAGDAEISDKRERGFLARPKVWVKESLVWGFAGDSRPGDLVRYMLRAPKPSPKDDVGFYVVTELVPAIRELLRKDGSDGDWAALVGVRGELWRLDGHDAERGAEGYAACGWGGTSALVGLALTGKLSPRARLTRVVGAVCRHVPGCGGRVTIVHG